MNPKMRDFLKNIGRLQEQDYITSEEFFQVFDAIYTAVKDSAVKNKDSIKVIEQVATKKAKDLEKLFIALAEAVEKRVAKIKDGEKGEDGTTPVAGVDYPTYKEIRKFIKDSVNDLPKPNDPKTVITVDYIKDSLMALEGNDRLPHTAIGGLEKMVDEKVRIAESNLRKGPMYVGGVGSSGTSGTSSPLTTKGDLWGYSTTDARVAVGADGTVLTADAATATGLKWAVPAGGGDVAKVGTPVNNQVGVWTGDGTLEGDANLTFDTATDILTAVGFAGALNGTVGATTPTTVVGTTIQANTGFIPDANDGAYLGTTTAQFSDLFLAEGGVINWDNGDATLTQTGNVLKLAGAALETDGNIELGHATDTTISRVSAGVIAVEGVNVSLTGHTHEGTAVLSTGEAGGTKFLREDGDGTCSWQTPSYPTRDSLGVDTDDSPQFAGIELGHASDTTITRAGAGAIAVEGTAVLLSGGALGTPASGTLTNCSGLPLSGVTDSTSEALGVGTLELGHASDTTLARVSAGVVSIENNNILTAATGLALAGGTMTGNITLAENASVDLDPALSADGKYTGICITGTAGATLAFGDLVYLAAADSRWELCDANAVGTAGTVLIGLCVLAAANDGDATKILLQGNIRADTAFPSFTISAPIYISETAGDVTNTAPTTADAVVRVVGFGLTADSMVFMPSASHSTVTG